MHFSIPDTEELKDEKGTFQAFNIHINGVLHCTVRYSQLHDLNEQLKSAFGASNVPTFPPKKLLTLRGGNLNDRRIQLENYIQNLSQEQYLCDSEEFNSFLHKAQQETRREETIAVTLNIYLLNGNKFGIDINSTEKTDDILEICASEIGIPEDFTYYFGLYLMHREHDDKLSVVRKLQGFESPYISLKSLTDRRNHRIVLRKAYWDQSYDDNIISNKTAFNMLLVQAINDVDVDWTLCSEDTKQRIHSLQKQGSKRECFSLCRTLSHYGYLQFKPCVTDFPQSKCRVIVSMGNYEVHFRIQVSKKEIKEAAFNVTKMKCWKVSSDFAEFKDLNKNKNVQDHPVLQLSFEFLIKKGELKWISLISDQAIMMSMCIKDMVDELLNKRKGGKIRKPSDREKRARKPHFKPRDKTSEILLENDEANHNEKESIKKQMSKSSSGNNNISSHNQATSDSNDNIPESSALAYDGIGDEDL